MMDNSLFYRKKLHYHGYRDENSKLELISFVIIFNILILNLFVVVIATPLYFSTFRLDSLFILSLTFLFQASLFTISTLSAKFIFLRGSSIQQVMATLMKTFSLFALPNSHFLFSTFIVYQGNLKPLQIYAIWQVNPSHLLHYIAFESNLMLLKNWNNS